MRLIVVVWVLLGLCLAGPALGQSPEARHRALTHFNQAEAYMKAEAYQEAAKEYLATYAIVPKPGFLFNAGLAYEAAGDKRRASEHYHRYLDAEPKGRAAPEARARAVKLDGEIAAEDAALAEAEREKQEAEKRRLLAESHAEAARRLVEAQQYTAAIQELQAAFATDALPVYAFRLAEAHRLNGEPTRALAQYDIYRQLDPTGPHAVEAIEKAALLRQELAEAARPKAPPPPPVTAASPAPPADTAEEEDEGVNWWWFGIGASLVVAGIITDWAPDSARNGTFDGLDVLPLAFYGTGATFMAIGVF